jgi:hypothetical protein
MAQPVNNRTDLLNPPTYGDKASMQRAQQAVPMGASPVDAQRTAPVVMPGSLPPLLGPTQRPNEPITAGANFGPGPSALQAGVPLRSETQVAVEELRAIAQLHPTEELTMMLDKWGLLK